MTEHDPIFAKAQSFFDDLWARDDPCELETSNFERERYMRLIALLKPSGYSRALEIGCGAGAFTRLLARHTDQLLALDISSKAIAKAQAAHADLMQVEFRVANIMDYDPKAEGAWDLIVMSETVYYLGWLYPFFGVAWLASELYAASRDGGQLLLANTQGLAGEPLLLPWIIRTYRDLFVNVGYELQHEEIFHGAKKGVGLDVMISLFSKTSRSDAKRPPQG